jgi:hypothetical protein
VGNLARRLAALEAHLRPTLEAALREPRERVATEALARLPTDDLRHVVRGLRRVEERCAGMPADAPIGPEVYEAILSDEELAALFRLGELEEQIRAEVG